MSAQQFQNVIDGQYVAGVDSLLYPTDLIAGSYAWGVNIVNRGGVPQTRPAKRRIVSFCGHNAQGAFWVRTMDDRNFKLIAVDGKIYWSPYPFVTWTQMPGVTFLADAPRIYFCNAEQAIVYNPDNSIKVLPTPKNIVFMQDGKSTPCYWDTDTMASGLADLSYTTGNPASPLPVGTVMLWQDNRMWVVAQNLVFASDLLYPQSFTENTYLAEASGFRFPRPVVQMVPSPGAGILVATQSSLHSLQSNISDRTTWSTTPDFQADVNLEIGFIAPWCYAYLHGMLWFMTARGVISYDRALTQNLTTVILSADGEMARSKNLMAPDVTLACMGVWENILMVSVPASSLYNRHTWIMDGGISQKLNNPAAGCWSGIWTGTYPVQYTSPIVDGTQHNYELSYSGGFLSLNEGESPSPQPETDLPPQAYIHLWENYMPNQVSEVETNINCSFETRAFLLQTDDYYRFVFAEFMIVNLKGVVPVQVYVTGLGGNYQPLFSTTLRADIGPWGNPNVATKLYYLSNKGTTEFENYRKQVRHMRTQEFIVHESPDQSACTEIQRLDGVDKAFQLMIQWQGRMGVRQIKFFYDRQLQSPQGVCPVDESITPHIVLEATA